MEKHEKAYIDLKNNGYEGWGGKKYQARMDGWKVQVEKIKDLIGNDVKNILEFGSGAGDVSILLAKSGFDLTGVEISPTAVEWARSKSLDENLEIEFIASSVCDESLLMGRKFDMLIDGNCLHCLFDQDREKFYLNAQRLIKAGGYLFISTAVKLREDDKDPNISFIERYIITEKSLNEELERHNFVRIKDWLSHGSHRHYYGLYKLEA